jgi:3-phosphoshikimate 1-carboxyvinyltransferase
MAPGVSVLRGGLQAEDTQWMRQALRGLGIPVHESPDGAWRVEGGARPRAADPLWLGASGTTLRFLLPWLALRGEGPMRLEGEPRLFERPLEPLLEPLRALGARWEPGGKGGILHPCRELEDKLDISVDASLSSQFLTGLALAVAGLPKGGLLRWDALASPSYLELTKHWLARFGCVAKDLTAQRYPAPHLIQSSGAFALTLNAWRIPGGLLRPVDLDLPADWSAAAAFLCAAAVTGRTLELEGLDPEDAQGDSALVDILEIAGCGFAREGHTLRLWGPMRRGIQADLQTCPDLGPVLAATAALAPGPSLLTGLDTLPLKECDRLAASADLVRWMGGRATIKSNHTLNIEPAGEPAADRGAYDPQNDHRMAFAAAVGGLRHGGELMNPGCVAKTFPDFWERWRELLA